MSDNNEEMFYIYRTDTGLKDEFLLFVNNQQSFTVNIEQAKQFTTEEKDNFLHNANKFSKIYSSISINDANILSEKMVSVSKINTR